MKEQIIGVDLAKNVFQLHGACSKTGKVIFKKKLNRSHFLKFMEQSQPCIIAMEACGSANFWSRKLASIGHEIRLIAPQYVRPFVKRQKNDAADAEAIVIAARQPEMRFVAPKTAEQQSRAVLFRARDRLVGHRTELVNSLRAILYEFGVTLPQGITAIKEVESILQNSEIEIPQPVREECTDLLCQIDETTSRIELRTKNVKRVADTTETSRRLQSMPGLGPMTALAIEAFAPDMSTFKRGRDFSAWLGLVPKQHSSGGKARLGRISKAGQSDIRRLLIIGAMSRLTGRGIKSIADDSWIAQMLKRKPKILVAIALANKMARQVWAMLMKHEAYREPAAPIVN